MKTWLLAIAVLGGCVDPDAEPGGGGGGGGKADDPNAAFGDVVTAWEHTVGYGGDAVVRRVATTDDGSLFVTSHFPIWLRKLSAADGKAVTTWGNLEVGWSPTKRTGYLPLTAHEIWQVGNGELVATVGSGEVFELQNYLADGTLNPAFGMGGRIWFSAVAPNAQRLAAEYDAPNERILVALSRAWNAGPSKVEIMAFDAHTGAQTSLGTYDLPAWDTDYTNPAKVRWLVARTDGSQVLIATDTIHFDSAVRRAVGTRWSMFHLSPGRPVVETTIAVSSYDPPVPGFARLAGGAFDLYLNGIIDDISTTDEDKKLVRFTVDDALAMHADVLGPALPISEGCVGSVATPSVLVFGHSPDRATQPLQFTAYPKGGAPIEFASDLPKRCLVSLSLAPDGHIYAGTWDTTNSGWTALLTSFVAR